ncbi:fumble [Meredithblackwellia eburnea MCA 4105]
MATWVFQDSQLPAGHQGLLVDFTGARLIEDANNADDPAVYLPMYEETISHIAVDIGGSLAKVVYFTRAPARSSSVGPSKPPSAATFPVRSPRRSPSPPDGSPAKPNGVLGPKSLSQRASPVASDASPVPSTSSSNHQQHQQQQQPNFSSKVRRSSLSKIPSGGRLNFIKFETTDLDSCIEFLRTLITSSAASNRVPLEVMKRSVKIMATGGGAHKFYARLRDELDVEVRREEEMECLVLGLGFVMEVPNEVFWYSDELVQAISHPKQAAAVGGPAVVASASSSSPSPSTLVPTPHSHSHLSVSTSPPHAAPSPPPTPPPETDPFPRPSPNPPQYSLCFDEKPSTAQFPCLLVNIGSGVSIIKVDDYGKFERISGTSLGGGTLWGILSLLTGAKSFDDMLALADQGDNSSVDMLVGDIYGQDYQKIGLKSSTIASSFGKVFKKDRQGAVVDGEEQEEKGKKSFKSEDISKSLLYAISNNIGQIAYMNAEKHNLDRIYFGGGFIRGHASTIATLSYAIRFWSKGTKRALFLRHEGYLGGIGAWLRNLSDGSDTPRRPNGERDRPLAPLPLKPGMTAEPLDT